MEVPQQIDDDEVIIRRIPPSTAGGASTKELHDGRHRATSFRMSTKHPDETGLSCSRMKLTSPRELLDQLQIHGIDPVGWTVCRLLVRDVRELGLDVVFCRTDDDPGHCEIRGKDGLDFPNKSSSRLAKKSLILTEEQIKTLKAGDSEKLRP